MMSRKVLQLGKCRYAILSKVKMGNSGFNGCLSELQVVSVWWKETAQTHIFVLPLNLLPY